ncbi:hypothetical protein EDB85DRAFT_2291636, partial [Lactarius pseudohatsudake]
MSPDFNSLAGLSLTILPEPARTVIAVPPCALSHPIPDPVHKLQSTVCNPGGARSARTVSSQLLPPPNLPVSDSGACVTTTNSAPATVPDPDYLLMQVWISTSTSTSLWTSRPGP